MLTTSPSRTIPIIKFEDLNWLAIDPLPRDQTQSRRLHEPGQQIEVTDPTYLDTPVNHPILRLPYPAHDGDDRGG